LYHSNSSNILWQWFDKKKIYLDALESQLKGLVKSIEAVSKQRAGARSHISSSHLTNASNYVEVITAIMEFSEAISALSASDLSKQLSNSLGVLSEVENKSKELQEEQAKDDMVTILGTGT
jgi:sorting nexin-1/2